MSNWRQDAACRGLDPNMFVDYGPNPRPVKRICQDCPVREDCLEEAVADPELAGIWGGTTADEREEIRRRRERERRRCRAPNCTNTARALGLCEMHYRRFRNHGTFELPKPNGPTVKICEVCGDMFQRNPDHPKARTCGARSCVSEINRRNALQSWARRYAL